MNYIRNERIKRDPTRKEMDMTVVSLLISAEIFSALGHTHSPGRPLYYERRLLVLYFGWRMELARILLISV
jgi:hypothetical protein